MRLINIAMLNLHRTLTDLFLLAFIILRTTGDERSFQQVDKGRIGGAAG